MSYTTRTNPTYVFLTIFGFESTFTPHCITADPHSLYIEAINQHDEKNELIYISSKLA